MGVVRAPFGSHAASPAELQEQIEADRRGDPYLLYRDGQGAQRILPLPDGWDRATIGRGLACDVCLSWDHEVSRLHARLERMGEEWIVIDDGLSRNGTLVNEEKLTGTRRLRDGDLVRCGLTEMAFRAPLQDVAETAAAATIQQIELSEAQRRVLVALCRPFAPGQQFASPATNQQIADELFLSVEAVKTHLRTLFARFGVEELQHGRKRARLVELAFESGAVTPRDLER